MKGIILAGGEGMRLRPFTYVTNKHLANVHENVMVYYPLKTLINAGIKDICIICGDTQEGDIFKLLGNGSELEERLGIKSNERITINHAVQRSNNPKSRRGAFGIAHAVGLSEPFVGKEKIAVILGDNFYEDNMGSYVKDFEESIYGANIFLKEIDDPERFGIAEIVKGKIKNIVEKPKKPKSNLAVTGLYFYDYRVFNIIKQLKPSKRGEYEITDVNNWYLKHNDLEFRILKGFWGDMGTFESRYRTEKFLAERYGFSK